MAKETTTKTPRKTTARKTIKQLEAEHHERLSEIEEQLESKTITDAEIEKLMDRVHDLETEKLRNEQTYVEDNVGYKNSASVRLLAVGAIFIFVALVILAFLI